MSRPTIQLLHLNEHVQAHSFSYLSVSHLISIATTCKTFSTFVKDPTYDETFFRNIVLCEHPGMVLSAMEKNADTSCNAWVDILKAGSTHQVEWLASEASDRVSLKKPNQSRSVYVIRVEAGGRRFLRLGGHYFFKIGFCTFDSHKLNVNTGRISCGKWFQPRLRGIGPAPLRGFALSSLDWKVPCLDQPVTVLFAGAETSYPYNETNEVYVVVALGNRGGTGSVGSSKNHRNNNRNNNHNETTTRWLWLRGDIHGTPPSPRRGCSQTPISEGRQIVFIGGSRTSPVVNLSDVHVLDMRGQLIECELDAMSRIQDVNAFPKTLSGMTWSTVNTTGVVLGRSSHSAFRSLSISKQSQGKHEQILVYGGFQLGGQTTLFDVHSLNIDLVGNGGKEEEEEEQKEEQEQKSVVHCSWEGVAFDGPTEPPGQRTGPGTFVRGRKMILVGGYDKTRWKEEDANESTAPTDVVVFDPLPTPRWYIPGIKGSNTPPPARCGSGFSVCGTVVLMSGGYESTKGNVRARLLNKVDSWRLKLGC
jgi:hypothetical protein